MPMVGEQSHPLPGHTKSAKGKEFTISVGPKKKKAKSKNVAEKRYSLERGSHNYGVKPLGNMYVDEYMLNIRDTGLGALKLLSDELLVDVLGLLTAKDLSRLASVSRSFYVFTHHSELWRNHVLNDLQGDFDFSMSWKQTYQRRISLERDHKPFRVKGFFSDYLFQSWLCASLNVKPEWLARDNIPRCSNLSRLDFIRNFEEPNRPVIITDAISDWPAMKRWDRPYLLEHAGHIPFATGPVEMTLERFYNYADCVEEERPLYVFDPHFGTKAPRLLSDYVVPKYFDEDLFSVLDSERPHYRWLIIGPARSGSSWHIDPNATSAWNAVVRGSKKWILFPPDQVPPGVHPSPDGADVATPVSITEWFMNFYDQTQGGGAPRPIEGICKAGEVLFVPHGWWHLVLNLEEAVAVTQNFVSHRNIQEVVRYLSRPNAEALVSGTRDRVSLHDRFRAIFEDRFPGKLEELQLASEEVKRKKQRKESFWESVGDKKTGGFKFDFGSC